MQDKLQVVLKTNLIRVPKKMKKMQIKEFVAEFGALPHIVPIVIDENSSASRLCQTAIKSSNS